MGDALMAALGPRLELLSSEDVTAYKTTPSVVTTDNAVKVPEALDSVAKQ
jgi:hypothetical protein